MQNNNGVLLYDTRLLSVDRGGTYVNWVEVWGRESYDIDISLLYCDGNIPEDLFNKPDSYFIEKTIKFIFDCPKFKGHRVADIIYLYGPTIL